MIKEASKSLYYALSSNCKLIELSDLSWLCLEEYVPYILSKKLKIDPNKFLFKFYIIPLSTFRFKLFLEQKFYQTIKLFFYILLNFFTTYYFSHFSVALFYLI